VRVRVTGRVKERVRVRVRVRVRDRVSPATWPSPTTRGRRAPWCPRPPTRAAWWAPPP